MKKSSAQLVNSHRFLSLVCLACLIFALSISLDAQTNVAAPLSTAAQEAFDKGIVAAREQGYIVALRYLQDARKIAPQAPQIFRSLGAVEAKIPGRELRAIAWYGAYLTATPNAADVADVKREIVRLDVKSQINISALIKSVQDAASAIYNRNLYGGEQMEYFSNVAVLWVKAGDVSAALRTADLYPAAMTTDKESALAAIAYAQVDAGDVEGARRTTETTELAQQQGLIDLVQGRIATTQAKSGHIAAAQKTAALIRSALYKSSAQRDIAEAQIEARDIAGARETLLIAADLIGGILKDSSDGVLKDNNLNSIVKVQIRAGDIAGAQRSADLIKDPDWKSFSQLAIAEAQGKDGDIVGAQTTADRIQRADSRSSAQIAIAETQIKAGDIVGAQRTLVWALKSANLIQDEYWKGLAQKFIAEAQIKAGDIAGAKIVLASALSTASLIPRAEVKSWAQFQIAEAQIRAGDIASAKITLASALKTANFIQDAREKSNAHVRIDERTKNLTNPPISTRQSTPNTQSPIQPVMIASDWLKKLDDNNKSNDCPLNAEPFLDLASYLKSLPRSDNPQEVFTALYGTAKTIVGAQNVISGMLKQAKR